MRSTRPSPKTRTWRIPSSLPCTRGPTWARLLPGLSNHEALYELRFEKITDDGTPFARSGDTIELVIAGAPAQSRLEWTLP